MPFELTRDAVILGFALIGTTGGHVDVPVEGRLVQRGRVLTKAEQNRNDRVGGAGQRGRCRARIVVLRIGGKRRKIVAQTCQRGEAGLNKGRGAARLVLFRIVADHPEADIRRGLEQRLGTDQVTVAIVDVRVVDGVVIEAVTTEIDAVDARRDGLAQRCVDPGFQTQGVVIAVARDAIGAEVELGRRGVDVDEASRRVTAAERALRTTQNLDAVERTQFG